MTSLFARLIISLVRSRLLINVCGEWCIQSQVLLIIRGRLQTQVLTELTADMN